MTDVFKAAIVANEAVKNESVLLFKALTLAFRNLQTAKPGKPTEAAEAHLVSVQKAIVVWTKKYAKLKHNTLSIEGHYDKVLFDRAGDVFPEMLGEVKRIRKIREDKDGKTKPVQIDPLDVDYSALLSGVTE